MKKQNIRLIALDMDGTLLTSTDEVSTANQKAIQAAQEAGVHVLICTGRWLKACSMYAEDLQLNTYLITANGGEIWSRQGELVERHLHASDVMEQLYTIGEGHGAYMWLVSTENVFHDHPGNYPDQKWLKIGYRSEDKEILRKIHAELPNKEQLEISNSSPYNIEVNPKGVNKANALERVCEELDLSMDEVMAVGDSLNDLKMIERAGIGVAMGNAQEVVKKAADYVTETNDLDGVAQAIEHFVLKS